MMKLLATVVLLTGILTAANAFATPITFDVFGNKNSDMRATVTAFYEPSVGLASFTILNTSTAEGTIMGFAFNLPNDGVGIVSITNLSANPGTPSPLPSTSRTASTPRCLSVFSMWA